MTVKPNAPASERNKQAILDVLKDEFRDCESVFEIGSGTGQHAVFFAAAMPWLIWQTSDLAENLQGIRAWIADSGLGNVRDPILLDVRESNDTGGKYGGVFSANTAHIMSIETVRYMFDVVGRLLSSAGAYCLYGPFNVDGEFTSQSNARFDESLHIQDPEMGIRDLAILDGFADGASMHRESVYAMPANNLLVVWRKTGVTSRDDS